MNSATFLKTLFSLQLIIVSSFIAWGQQVPILNYFTNANGQIEIEVNSTPQHYYVLKVRHTANGAFELSTSMTLGENGSTIITEPLSSYPLDHYQVFQHAIQSPADTDGDGLNDMLEYQNIPIRSPLNAAPPINVKDGLTSVDNFTTFTSLSITKDFVQWNEFLNGKKFVKYIIVDFHTTAPKIYFINSDEHNLHKDFAGTVGIDVFGNQVKKGQVIYHPKNISNGGSLGTFAFNFSGGDGEDFDVVQRTHELLAANMPFLTNNLSYLITANNEDELERDSVLFQNSRIPVIFQSDIYAGLDYWGLNPAEGFGFFRHITAGETPGSKDIALYESLPNFLPRVGGVMTSVIQTPLSHVNLRAIQNNIPNAFIRDPLLIDSISDLINHYIYFKVEQGNYFIREATIDEVNDWFEKIRPPEEQIPPLNLDYTSILPLDDINFKMFDGFGAKCANVATMRTFGFPENTIPDGYGVPFYFYQEFMKHNDFFEEVATMINDSAFIADRTIRELTLKNFRDRIKDANMPNWMLNELDMMHQEFPIGTSVRCRSSTNNEDLPGFSGAGLYDSKTQHPDEGHISKSIKQVYASLWNLRAFEERDFYRVNHFIASMGVLCHPNYTGEKANGVGVSQDPVYNTENTFYLNSQIGEELITNPSNNSIPEEILMDRVSVSDNDYTIIQRTNLSVNDTTIMSEYYLDQMREYLSIIHDKFKVLYNASYNSTFAMDIEYKITVDDQLIIKQARPWVSYIPITLVDGGIERLDLTVFPNPVGDYLFIQCNNCNLNKIRITDITGSQIQERTISNLNDEISVRHLSSGTYVLTGFSETGEIYSAKFIKY